LSQLANAEAAADAETEPMCPGLWDLGVSQPLHGESVLRPQGVCDVAWVEIGCWEPHTDLFLFLGGVLLFFFGRYCHWHRKEREEEENC